MFDLIIKNGTVIDGQKTARFRADVAIRGDRIVAVGALPDGEAAQSIDAAGHIVAPGFIDTHTHSDAWLLKKPHLISKTSQGFTTEMIMLDGISYAPVNQDTAVSWIYYLRALNGLQLNEYQGWRTIGEYMALLNGRNVQNSATFVPYANVRSLACGFGIGPPDDYQLRHIQQLIAQGMADGAVGLSTGLDYLAECFAGTDELVAACEALRPYPGATYVTHVRYKSGTLAGVKEAVAIGRRAGVAVHISHLKGSHPAEVEAILDYIDRVAINEVDFSFDVYPYMPSSTMLNYLLPYEVWRDGPLGVIEKLNEGRVRRIFDQNLRQETLDAIHIAWLLGKGNSRHQGQLLSDYIAETGRTAGDALADLLLEEGLAVLLVFNKGEDELVYPFLAHERYMMGSDGIFQEDGRVHPRQFGSATRLLGKCVREAKLFSLEEAVYKLSGFPAARFGLTDRGVVAAGKYADLVIFDPDLIADRATYEEPRRRSVGVRDVVVNGVQIVGGGVERPLAQSGGLPGRFLPFNG